MIWTKNLKKQILDGNNIKYKILLIEDSMTMPFLHKIE